MTKLREETLQVCFGCLLHDIGKLVYRAGGDSGNHSRQGREFLRQLWPEEKVILDCVGLHHAAELREASLPSDSAAWIAYAADNLSAAADRRKSEESDGSFRRYLPLASVFTHMNGEHPGFSVSPYPQDGKLRQPRQGMPELNADQYRAAVEALRLRLAELPRSEAWLDSLLCLLECHTGMFPSSTHAGESPDVSLFDHLKTTAAIGSCISEYLAAEGERNFKRRLFEEEKSFREEKAFLLYSADFSGIQRFLYMVASDKALRSLRSRSFFLEITMEHYIDELLQCCGVSRANLLYSGGGHCYILLPNTQQTLQAAESWNRRFNDWLAAEFGSALFLAHGWTPCSGNELTNTPAENAPYKAMFRRVSAAVSRHKLHRYDAAQLRMLNRPGQPGGRECKICGRTDRLNDDCCPWCRLFVELSEKIQTRDVYFVSRDDKTARDFALPAAEGMVYFSLIDEKTARARLDGGEAVVRVYSKNKVYTGLRYSTRIYVGDYAHSNRMDELARSAAGIRRIGVCRMDVDDLGQSFVSGFECAGAASASERQHFVTLSRTAAFSRQLSLFFKCYINEILSGRFGNKPALAVTVVYSGGDDVFLVGAWNDTIEAAMRIREAFTVFSCGALTISAGLCIVDDHFPIRLAAERAGALEARAKEEPNKDAIALFDPHLEHTYSWTRFGQKVLGEKLALLRSFFNNEKQTSRGKAFLYRILDLLRASQEENGKLQLARYAYLLSRLEPAPSAPDHAAYRHFADAMYQWALDSEERRALITAIYIYVYEIRKGETE